MSKPYTFGDLVRYSGASKSNITNWVQKGVIKPDVATTRGTGDHREFGFLDLLQARVAHDLNQLPGGMPSYDLAEAIGVLESGKLILLHDSAKHARAENEVLAAEGKPRTPGIIGMFLEIVPGAPRQNHPWLTFLNPATRGIDDQFSLCWCPNSSSFASTFLVEDDDTVTKLRIDCRMILILNLREILETLEEATGDHWTPTPRSEELLANGLNSRIR
jgi:hypothetical protein